MTSVCLSGCVCVCVSVCLCVCVSGKEAEDDQRVPLRRSLKSAIKKGDRFSGYFPRHHHQEDDDHDKVDELEDGFKPKPTFG